MTLAVANKTICILHANCLGDALRPLLESIPAFARYFSIYQYTNFRGDEIPESISENCGLYLYQFLAPKWGALSSEQMLSRLPAKCTSLEIPNFLFKGYWPFWLPGSQVISFCDSVLENLLAQGLTTAEILYLYTKGDSAILGDITDMAKQNLLALKAKDNGKEITYSHIIEELWQEEQLFLTVNHPAPRLIFHVAASILRILGLGELPETSKLGFQHPHDDFWLPIHPVVGNILGLPFADEDRRYRIYNHWLTHKEYTSCYLACRSHGEKELLVMLNNLSKDYKFA